MEYRPYQKIAIEKGVEFFKQRKSAPSLIVAPCAAGKSLIISRIAHELGEKCLVLQHSQELLRQNYDKLLALGGEASVFSASFNSREIGEITYATIGTIAKLGGMFKELGIKYLIQDESHLFPREPDGMFRKFITESGITRILGLTATPFKLQANTNFDGSRYSKLQMLTSRSKKGKLFKDIIHITQIEEMIENGWWSKLEYDVRDVNRRMLELNSTGADYTDGSLQRWWVENQMEPRIVKCLAHRNLPYTLVFVPSIEDALSLERHGGRALYSGMPNKEREQIITGFKAGLITPLINVSIMSTGVDIPQIRHIILGRPTNSLAALYQWIGRGVRILEGKESCLITDFGGNIDKFGIIGDLIYSQHSGQWQLYSKNKQLTNIAI